MVSDCSWSCPDFWFLGLFHSVEKKKILHRQLGPLRGSSSAFSSLSRRGLNPINPAYDLDWLDSRLNLTASAPNKLGQYTSSPGHRGYCYSELAVFFPNGGRNHCQHSLCLPTEDVQAELAWVAGYVVRQFTCPKAVTHPTTNRAQCRATALIVLTHYRYTKPPQLTSLKLAYTHRHTLKYELYLIA